MYVTAEFTEVSTSSAYHVWGLIITRLLKLHPYLPSPCEMADTLALNIALTILYAEKHGPSPSKVEAADLTLKIYSMAQVRRGCLAVFFGFISYQ